MVAKLNIDQRCRDRVLVDQSILVHDMLKQAPIGRLVNIHDQGFMAIGNNTARENRIYQLELLFSELIEGKDKVQLGAECLWTRETDSGDQYWAGFHIVDLADQDLSTIQLLASQV